MTTALEIIEGAMSKIGRLEAGQSVSSEDSTLCLDALNSIVDAWNLQNLTAHALVTLEVSLLAGVDEVTLSPRYVRIESGFTRVDSVDYPLALVHREVWEQIAVKTAESIAPEWALYEPELAAGALFLYPQAAQSCTLHLTVQERIEEFADLATDYALPQGMKRALVFNLATEIAPDFRLEAPPSVHAGAINSLKSLKRARVMAPQMEVSPIKRRYDIQAGF